MNVICCLVSLFVVYVATEKTDKGEHDVHNCSPGTYYDPVVRNCDPCAPHCSYIPVEDPPVECVDFCRAQKTISSIPNTKSNNGANEHNKPVAKDSEAASRLYWIILPLLIVVAIIPVVIYKQKQHGRGQTIDEESEMTEINPVVVQPENIGIQEETEQDRRSEQLLG